MNTWESNRRATSPPHSLQLTSIHGTGEDHSRLRGATLWRGRHMRIALRIIVAAWAALLALLSSFPARADLIEVDFPE
jgi:hypothetical protein